MARGDLAVTVLGHYARQLLPRFKEHGCIVTALKKGFSDYAPGDGEIVLVFDGPVDDIQNVFGGRLIIDRHD